MALLLTYLSERYGIDSYLTAWSHYINQCLTRANTVSYCLTYHGYGSKINKYIEWIVSQFLCVNLLITLQAEDLLNI